MAILLVIDAEAVEEAKARGDYGAVANDPVVVPQRAATGMKPFVPYVSAGQASPQVIHDRTGVLPVSVTHSDDPEWLRYSFFKCEEHNWSDPDWTCMPGDWVEAKENVPVDNALYWREEHSETVVKDKSMLFIAPFTLGSMWADAGVRWQDYGATRGWGKQTAKRIVT